MISIPRPGRGGDPPRARNLQTARAPGDPGVEPVVQPGEQYGSDEAVPTGRQIRAVPWMPPASLVFGGPRTCHVAELGHQQAGADAEQDQRDLNRSLQFTSIVAMITSAATTHRRADLNDSLGASQRRAARERRDQHRHRHRQQPLAGLECVESEDDLKVDGEDEEGSHQHELLRHQRRQTGAEGLDAEQRAFEQRVLPSRSRRSSHMPKNQSSKTPPTIRNGTTEKPSGVISLPPIVGASMGCTQPQVCFEDAEDDQAQPAAERAAPTMSSFGGCSGRGEGCIRCGRGG